MLSSVSPAASSSSSVKNCGSTRRRRGGSPRTSVEVGRAGEPPGHADDRDPTRRGRRSSTAQRVDLTSLPRPRRSRRPACDSHVRIGGRVPMLPSAMPDGRRSTRTRSRPCSRGCCSTGCRRPTSASTSSRWSATSPRTSTSPRWSRRGSGSPTAIRSCARGSAGPTVDEPVQEVVDRRRPCRSTCATSRHLTADRAGRPSSAAFLVDDRLRGFDLGAAPLWRLTLLQLGPARERFVFTYHHSLLDTSVVWVVEEAFRTYDAMRRGEVAELEDRAAVQGPHRCGCTTHLDADRPAAQAYYAVAARRVRRRRPG